MALEQLGVVPSKILNLDAEKNTITAEMARRIKELNPELKGKFFKLHVQVNNMYEKHCLY
jgi:plasmid maintenance system antidote protein VapI